MAAIGPFLLAVATFLLVWETRRARIEAARDRRRSAFRAALVDLLDQCRTWATTDASARHDLAARLAQHLPNAAAAHTFLGAVTVPQPVLKLVLWHLAQARDSAEAMTHAATALHPHGHDVSRGTAEDQAAGQVRIHQALTLDHLQTATCLIAREAREQGFPEVSDAFDGLAWLDPQANVHRAQSATQGREPAFPDTPGLAPCSPASRDARAAEIEAAQGQAFRGSPAGPMEEARDTGAVRPPDFRRTD